MICGKCKRDIADGEPVTRLRIKSHRYHNVICLEPVCGRCFKPADDQQFTAEDCEGCGRLVHQVPRAGRWRTFCCDECRGQVQTIEARKRRTDVRGVKRPCALCGERFDPARNDARFCSPACRQKAYRRRVTDNQFRRAAKLSIRNAERAAKR